MSHGWGGAPLLSLSRTVLGVSPEKPGCNVIGVVPHFGDLKFAKGSMPTPHGAMDVSWKLRTNGFTMSFTIPQGSEAGVCLPYKRFKDPIFVYDKKRTSLPIKFFNEGQHDYWIRGDFISFPAETNETTIATSFGDGKISADSAAAFESDVVKDNLISLDKNIRVEEHASHLGGGKNADALRNGTTLNGDGGTESKDDGKTFRGYADHDFLTFHLDTNKSPHGYDITKITTFAGHNDGRASQNYSVSVAQISAPEKFASLAANVSVKCNGGSSEIVLTNKITAASAVRFDFKNGPEGFNVYREIEIIGTPSK